MAVLVCGDGPHGIKTTARAPEAKERTDPSRPALFHPSRRLLGFLFRRRLLHGAHVEVEQAFALVALFLVLLAQFDDLLEDLDVEPLALGLRENFLLLLV